MAVRVPSTLMVRLYHLLRTAEEVEAIAAEIYEQVARRVDGGDAARALFRRLAEEERQHRLRITSLTSVYRHERSHAEGAEFDTGDLDSLLGEGRVLLTTVTTPLEPVHLQDALRLGRALELNFARVHAEVLAQQAWPAMASLFLALADQDRAHAELLDRAARSLVNGSQATELGKRVHDAALSASPARSDHGWRPP